tara:strand:+ start:701 stop:1546 length:846 start_codon:yes stop_codon:yes gene_type:complete
VVTKDRRKWKERSTQKSKYGTAEAPDPFPISRSRLEKFHACPRCFWLDRVKGVDTPGIPSFLLNTLVDTLLKREFDVHREEGTPHPYMSENGLDHMVPLAHDMMDEWRENFKGVRVERHGLLVFGAVDDIWMSKEGDAEEWFVVDYKSTATKADLTADLFLEDIYKGSYVRQMAIYQWLLRELGHPVSTRGFFVYENGNVGDSSLLREGSAESPRGIPLKPALVIEIDTADPRTVIEGERIDLEWVDGLVRGAKECLDLSEPPKAGEFCHHCAYVSAASQF